MQVRCRTGPLAECRSNGKGAHERVYRGPVITAHFNQNYTCMLNEHLTKTVIGTDYLRNNTAYPIDTLLDYLSGLLKMKLENDDNEVWSDKYLNEINAVKYILTQQTA
jgi:hypothetical protein